MSAGENMIVDVSGVVSWQFLASWAWAWAAGCFAANVLGWR